MDVVDHNVVDSLEISFNNGQMVQGCREVLEHGQMPEDILHPRNVEVGCRRQDPLQDVDLVDHTNLNVQMSLFMFLC